MLPGQCCWFLSYVEEPAMLLLAHNPEPTVGHAPWNKGKLIVPKPPFRLQEIWAIRMRLDIEHRIHDLPMFNLQIDSELRGCELVRLKVGIVMHGRHALSLATIIQHKAQQPFRFELTTQTRDAVKAWIDHASLHPDSYLFPGKSHRCSTRLDAAVRPDHRVMGRDDRAQSEAVRYPLAAAHQGRLGLPANREPA
jgi:integrase